MASQLDRLLDRIFVLYPILFGRAMWAGEEATTVYTLR